MSTVSSLGINIPDRLLPAAISLKRSYINVLLFIGGIYFSLFKRTYDYNGLRIHIPFELTDILFRGRFTLNKYEAQEARYLKEYLSPKAKVIELGGCLGFISCLTNRLLEDPSAHVVLEANPNLIAWIEKNKLENNCQFEIRNTIISTNEENDFYIHDLIVGGSTKRVTGTHRIVKGELFSDISTELNINFDTLIMDIEGGELGLLRNHKSAFGQFNQIFMEVHPQDNILTQAEADECDAILRSLGFDRVVTDGNFQIWEK